MASVGCRGRLWLVSHSASVGCVAFRPTRDPPVPLGTPGPWSWEAGWEPEGTSLGGGVLASTGGGAAETQSSFHGGPLGGPEGPTGKAACWPSGRGSDSLS